MIRTLKLKNFQSHKETVLEFSKGVNVIAGQSDSGKTAAIRGLRWLLTNKPQGDAFRSHWGGDTVVEVEFDDGTVTRGRVKKRDNFYSWDKDDTEFKAFGSNVPDEILSFLNMDSVNVQGQLDSPFLLAETPGEVAKYLNSIANLEMIDKATFNINQRHNDIDSEIKNLNDKLEELHNELDKFDDFNTLDRRVKKAEKLAEKIKGLETDKEGLIKCVELCEEYQKELEEARRYVRLDDIVTNIFRKESQRDGLSDQIIFIERTEKELEKARAAVKLEGRVDSILSKQNDKEELLTLLSLIHTEQVGLNKVRQWVKLEQKVTKALANGDSFIEKKRDLAEFEKALVVIQNIIKDRKELKESILETETRLKEEMPEICPLCEQPIKEG